MITEEFKDIIRACEQCGTCTASCPTQEASDFNIRKLVRRLQLELHENKDFLKKFPWLCTQCLRCSELCTEGLKIPKLVMELRKLSIKNKVAPKNVSNLNKSLKEFDSPYQSQTRNKETWIDKKLNDSQKSSDADLLYWVGCTPSIMAPNIANATAEVLKKLNLDYNILKSEPCCGEPLLSLGLIDEAKDYAVKVKKELENANIKKLVTSCSGCYNTFKRLYPEILGIDLEGIEILHTSQVLSKNMNEEFKLEKPLKLTYHDPCSLGRHSNVYDAPREVLESIEGINFIELERSKECAKCCGGGGGILSLDYKMAMEIAGNMLKNDIIPLDVEGLVTCCPSCYLNFRRTVLKNKIQIKVYDLSEVAALCVGL
jgi:Fe-S oxidoreductase